MSLTDTQLEANRANAQLSTGPITPEGKAVSSRNAVTTGLTTTKLAVIRSDDEQRQFEKLHEDLLRDLVPFAGLEQILFDQVLIAAWNMRRCEARIAELSAEGLDPLSATEPSPQFRNIEKYHARNERNFQRALKQLREIQTERTYRELTKSPAKANNISVMVRTQTLRKACLAEDLTRTKIESTSISTSLKVPELPAHRYDRDNSQNLLRKL